MPIRLALLLAVLTIGAIVAFVTGSPVPAATPSLIWRATIRDAQTGRAVVATIIVDEVVVASGVTHADVPIAADAQFHALRVLADGYRPWTLILRGVTKDGRILHGPVQLVPMAVTQQARETTTEQTARSFTCWV